MQAVADRMNWWANQVPSRLDVQYLPFVIKLVQTGADMDKAVQVRHTAYARHLPDFAETLKVVEEADYWADSLVLVALSKLDGSPLGSIRMQANFHRPLDLEASIVLPDWLHAKRLVEVTRLAVMERGVGRMVKIALIKACFDHCERAQMDYAIVTGRPPIDRQYEQLMFVDVVDGGELVPLKHVGNIPHRVMAFDIATGDERWKRADHPMYDFFKKTRHPDIEFETLNLGAAWTA